MRLTLSLWLAAMAAAAAPGGPAVRYLGQAKYLNGMKAVATHSIDDTTPTVATALEVIDRCGIKATIFVNTAREPIDKLWPRLRQAIADGHEIGAHGRTHPCTWPPNDELCREYYTNDQVVGSRDDILKNTPQPYVWSWAYPCGHCVELPGIQQSSSGQDTWWRETTRTR